jgi:hypothetical protein
MYENGQGDAEAAPFAGQVLTSFQLAQTCGAAGYTASG